MSSSLQTIRSERLQKLKILTDKGINPYPADVHRTHAIEEFLHTFEILYIEKTVVTLDGRIVSSRVHGGSAFLDLSDGTGTIQIYLKKDEIGEEVYDLFIQVVDTSDFIETTGTAFITQRGEKSLLVQSWRMLTKSIRPVPDAWFGLKDEETRYRLRYLDILLNKHTAQVVLKRSVFWNSIRSYLLERGFIEVETPVLETKTGGAEARPFITHHNALDIDVYLRISAGELWQKKLLVAGLPKVFEIGRIFRNEGMSREHLQDYTQLEFYIAYMDYIVGMEMVKDLYQTIAQQTFGTTNFTVGTTKIDLAGEWQTYNFTDLMKEHYKFDALDTYIDEVKNVLTTAHIKYEESTLNIERGIDLLWKKIRGSLSGPGFLIGVPVYLETLAKRSRSDSRIAERFQVIIAGSEMGKGFSELNDPQDQQERFLHQQNMRDAGDTEAQMADEEFVEALEYGMPPAFGFGLSERLFSTLMDIDVREGQIFPLMRPK